MKPFNVTIGGEAGFGITTAGTNLAKVITRSGYHCFEYLEYPSLIRGGHNVVSCSISSVPVLAPYKHINLLVAFNQETIDRHEGDLAHKALVLYDAGKHINVKKFSKHIEAIEIPFSLIAKKAGETILMRDTVALGAVIGLLNGKLSILINLLREEFAKKGDEVMLRNIHASSAGFEFVKKNHKNLINSILHVKRNGKRLVINANQAVAMGAIAGGMQFAAIYPMTPTSNILHVLAPLQDEFRFIYKQPEDEISAINMAIGASFAGARSMVATAGGGFCLMTEGYGLAGMTETPLVIIEGMRPGPATGLPTWTGQADLSFLLSAAQDEFPKIILTPGDVEEVFHMTMQAFNLADIYQTPVVVMVDKHLCESFSDVKPFGYKSYSINRGKYSIAKIANYMRYKIERDGISWRIPAGRGVHVVANSDEHAESGFSNEEALNRVEQMGKRMAKIKACAQKHMPEPVLYGAKNAELTIVSWGSNKGAILEAIKHKDYVNYLHINWVSPFPAESVKWILSHAKNILNIENNYSGQMRSLIAEKTGINIKNNLLKFDGRPIYPEEIVAKINEIL